MIKIDRKNINGEKKVSLQTILLVKQQNHANQEFGRANNKMEDRL